MIHLPISGTGKVTSYALHRGTCHKY